MSKGVMGVVLMGACGNVLEEVITDQVPDLLQDAARSLLRNILN